MKIATWNIRHGGSKLKLPGILASLLKPAADILIITEFQTKSAHFLESGLKDAGYDYLISSQPPEKMNGILIASKYACSPKAQHYHPNNPYRWLEVELPGFDINILALHIPEWGSKWDKATFWKEVIHYAKDHLHTSTILGGDFNTGLELDTTGEEFACPEYMAELVDLGWVEAWRKLHPDLRDYTWRSPRHWFSMRLDYIFLSPGLGNRMLNAQHNHTVRLEEKLSDHSMLIADMINPR